MRLKALQVERASSLPAPDTAGLLIANFCRTNPNSQKRSTITVDNNAFEVDGRWRLNSNDSYLLFSFLSILNLRLTGVCIGTSVGLIDRVAGEGRRWSTVGLMGVGWQCR